MNARRFTLVELLTVIVIIMILIGILMPTISIVIRKAEENQTKVRISALVTAIKQYESQYGVLPAYNGDPGTAISADIAMTSNANIDGLIKLLVGGNTRGIGFLEPTDQTNPYVYTDAWGKRLKIALDTNYDGTVKGDLTTIPGLPTTDSLYTNTAIWSNGPDETAGTSGDAGDDVVSWD